MDPLFDLPALIRSTWERLPRRVWLGLGVALLALVVDLWQSRLGYPGVPFDVSALLSLLVPSIYCLLAAALWMGVRLWSSGRRSAEWAAALFLVAGALEFVFRVMIATGIGLGVTGTDPTNYPLLIRSLVESAAVLGAGALLARGLWQGHGPITRGDRSALLALGALGVAAGALMIAADVYMVLLPNVLATAWVWPLDVLDGAWVASLVAVCGSTLVRPWRFRAARVAVGIGALGVAMAHTAEIGVILFVAPNGPDRLWGAQLYTLFVACTLVFLVLLGAGLFVSAERDPGVQPAA